MSSDKAFIDTTKTRRERSRRALYLVGVIGMSRFVLQWDISITPIFLFRVSDRVSYQSCTLTFTLKTLPWNGDCFTEKSSVTGVAENLPTSTVSSKEKK